MKKMKMFACCIPVKGAKRSTICDLQRNSYDIVPNSLFEFISHYEGKTVQEILDDFTFEEKEIAQSYIDFLLDRQYIFFTDIPESFIPIKLEWDAPHFITNAIIDFSSQSNHDLKQIVEQLTLVRCQGLELRFFDAVRLSTIEHYLELTNNSTLRSLTLVVKFENEFSEREVEKLFSKTNILTSILFHSAIKNPFVTSKLPVFFTTSKITDETHCGVVSSYNFNVNMTTFTESQQFNSCLNRKISVDKNGFIKNCPSSSACYGHISEISLIQAIQKKGFKDVWYIKKDQIEVCKDCEFRYICIDCRAYRADESNLYSKPAKCKYDPYTATYEQ